jgi:hypothetical protein
VEKVNIPSTTATPAPRTSAPMAMSDTTVPLVADVIVVKRSHEELVMFELMEAAAWIK